MSFPLTIKRYSIAYINYVINVYVCPNKLESLQPKDALYQFWLILVRKKKFLNSSIYSRHFVINSPWKRAWHFIWTNLNFHHPRMLCAKFGRNWPSGSGDKDDNVKSLQTDRRTTDLSFLLRWAKKVAPFRFESLIRDLRSF